MAGRKRRFRIGLVVLVTISLFVCPLAAGGFGTGGAHAQIAFTPNVATLAWTQTVEGPGLEVVQTQEPPPVISAGSLDIGSRTYPVGDEFDDASGLRLAGVRSDPLGSVGIATSFE